MWLWDYFWKEWEGHTGSDEDGYDFSCLQSAPPLGSIVGAAGNEI